jgi:two-component system CheB/CheR fusion protein
VKRAQEALEVSEERNALAMRAARLGPWDWNLRSGRLEWADSVEPMFGLSPGEFGGSYDAFLECVHPQDRNRVSGAVDRALREQADLAVEHRVVWPDSSVHWLAETGEVLYQSGRPVRMVGVVQDITERVERERELMRKNRELETMHVDLARANHELEDNEALLQGILRAVPAGMGLLQGRRLRWVSPSLAAITGYGEAELVGEEVEILFPDPATCDSALDQADSQLRDGVAQPHATRWRRKDGGEAEVLMRFAPLCREEPEAGIIFAGMVTPC